MFYHGDQIPEVNSLLGFILAPGFRGVGPVAAPLGTQHIMTEVNAGTHLIEA